VATIGFLAEVLAQIRLAAGLPTLSARELGELLQPVLDRDTDHLVPDASDSGLAFLEHLDAAIDLSVFGRTAAELRDRSAFDSLIRLARDSGVTLEQLAGSAIVRDKVILTTYHSAKGREFPVVMLPGLVEGVMPRLQWNRRQRRYGEPSSRLVAEERRTFYVALTRAKDAVLLVTGPGFEGTHGYWNEYGPSRFAIDVVQRLGM
jgi:DNA helicase-2/ATP-dependent DNA helicase PcrA